MTEEPIIKLSRVNKWILRPLHQRRRFARNESLNSLMEFFHLFRRVHRLFGSFETAKTVDAEVVPALRELSLEITAGSAVAVIDPDGVGKTALIQVVGQAALVNGGTVQINGQVINLGVLTSLIMGNYTARQNLHLMGDLLGFDSADLDRALPEAIALAGAQSIIDLPLRRIGSRPFADLAVALACCLAPAVIVAEEILPTLSPGLRRGLSEKYRTYLDSGGTIVFSAKKLDTILDLSTHLLLIEDGRTLAFGRSQDVMDSHGEWVAESVEAAAKLAVSRLIIEDEEDLDEAGLLDGEAGDVLLDGGAQLEIDLGQAEGLGVGMLPAQGRIAKRLRKSTFEQIGGQDYKSHSLEVCRMVEQDSEPIMFERSGAPMERIRVGSGRSKFIDTDESFYVEFHLETTEPNLHLLPMIDIFAKDLAAVRTTAPSFYRAPDPGRIKVRFDFPANVFAERFYILHAVVAVRRGESPDAELCILRDLDCFDGGKYDPISKQQLPPSEHKVDGRMGRPMVESKADSSLEPLTQTEICETRSFRLICERGAEFESQESEDLTGLEVRLGEALDLSILAQVLQPDVTVESVVELWIDRYFALRLLSHEPMSVAAPSQVRLDCRIPPHLLMDHRYRLRVGVLATERRTGRQQLCYHAVEPTLTTLGDDAEEPGSTSASLFECGAPPITSLSLPCAMEAVPPGDGPHPSPSA